MPPIHNEADGSQIKTKQKKHREPFEGVALKEKREVPLLKQKKANSSDDTPKGFSPQK
jgi:hypothetical protein